MKYRKFGKTGKQCSAIGFGGMRFPKDDAEAVRSVRAAIDLGINYFDTAPMYCEDRSEDLIGRGIKGYEDKVYVSTKSSISLDPKAGDVVNRIESQLKRLGLECITFYHMWCILDLDQYEKIIAPGGPLDGALKAKEQGKIEHILLSAHANGEEIEKIVKSGLFEGITLGYNIMNHTNRYSGMRAAHDHDLGVVIMNPLGGGMIAKAPDAFRYLTGGPDESPTVPALRFLLYHREVDVVLCGMGGVEEVKANAAVADQVDAPDPGRVDEMKEMIQALGDDYCTMCRYCTPCPSGIQIPYFVFAVDRCRLNDFEGAKGWIDWLRNSDKFGEAMPADCTECEECLPRCTQKLPIIERLKEFNRLFRPTR